MVGKGKRKRADAEADSAVNPPAPQRPRAYPNDPLSAATRQDQLTWKGYCEIESEPVSYPFCYAFFNVMLKEFGVKGVKTMEVFSFDDESLAEIPKPIYGLIFLFRYKGDDSDDRAQDCPEEVWFANQTSANSCASVALLNITMNISNARLGDNLASFKEFTKEMTPALRGNAIDNYEFVKRIHNSFARKMDMLEADLLMKNNVEKEGQKKKKAVKDDDNEEYGECYHFIAYVPVNGRIWSLDGLEEQPRCLGSFGPTDDWFKIAMPSIQARMAAYENEDITFNLLAMIRKPAVLYRAELHICDEYLGVINEHLQDLHSRPNGASVADRARQQSPPSPPGTSDSPKLPACEPPNPPESQQGQGQNNYHDLALKYQTPEDFWTPAASDEAAGKDRGPTTMEEKKVEHGDDQGAKEAEPTPHPGPERGASPQHSPDEEPPSKRQKMSASDDPELADDTPMSTSNQPEKALPEIIPPRDKSLIKQCDDLPTVLQWKKTLERGILDRKRLIAEGEREEQRDEEQANSRRWDYGPFIRRWLGLLVQKGIAKEIFADMEAERKLKEKMEKEAEKAEKAALKAAAAAANTKGKAKGKAASKKKGKK
ncbi:MAG: hypothetical protein M1816_008192 [Peltula sp. TS41687]|nr:MAG: hypothetical protein M1816_008192 [Peltula sp. TS41687]